MKWIILEETAVENFWPLSRTRPTWQLRFGIWSPLERALLETPNVALRVRPELAAYARITTGLLVNEDLDAHKISGEARHGLPYLWPWQILAHSDELIVADYERWAASNFNCREDIALDGVHLIGDRERIHLGANVSIQAGCVLDATQGPIVIGDGVQIQWSHLQGPIFIGKDCSVNGARVRPGTSIGHACKIGGEISASIFQSRVNKAHDGFVGHSWAGRWVNFGALATTSNLKNSYGKVRFSPTLDTTIDTGEQFLGSLIGDHTKIGIGQLLTTGSHIGPGCNIFGGGVAPKYVPAFCWGGAEGWAEHRLDDGLKTARAVTGRRSFDLRQQSETALRHVFAQTAVERAAFLKSRARMG